MEIVVFDNGGRTDDRYCVVVDNKRVYTLAADPLSPGGVRYLCDAMDLDTEEAGRSVDLEDLPRDLMRAIETNRGNWFRGRCKAA